MLSEERQIGLTARKSVQVGATPTMDTIPIGARVLLEVTVIDVRTKAAPDPLPLIKVQLYRPDPEGYSVSDLVSLNSDGGGNYSGSYIVPENSPEGAYKGQALLTFPDQSEDRGLKQVLFYVSTD